MVGLLSALVAGGVLGAGLLVSGMVDTTKVQGWLDVFGDWNPTLAFVLGGAIVPMAIAWRVAERRKVAVLGGPLPLMTEGEARPGRNLIIGSTVFGAGWALAGLCPGPALASLTFGGTGGIVFVVAMAAGMLAAPPIRARLDRMQPA